MRAEREHCLWSEHKTQLHRWPNYYHRWHCTSLYSHEWVNGISGSRCGWKILRLLFFVVMKNKRNICQRTITRYRVVVADSRVHQNDSVEFMIRLFMIGSGDGDGDNMRAQIYWYCTRHSENRWTERRTCRPVCGAHRDIANHHDDCFRRQQFCFVFLAVVVDIPLRWMKEKRRKKSYKMNIKQ